MEIKETLALVPTVINGIKTIRETCNDINVGFLPQNRQKLKELQQQIKELEEQIQSGFPKLASLTRAYADVSAEIGIAKALSDKDHELLKINPSKEFVKFLFIMMPSDLEKNCSRVKKAIANLPEIDTTVFGQAQTYLENIRRNIDLLKQVTSNNSLQQDFDGSKHQAERLTGEIATFYSLLDGILSNLLNRILENIGKTTL